MGSGTCLNKSVSQLTTLHNVRLLMLEQADSSRVSTRDVWPWEILVPWLEEDIKRRALENPISSLSGQLDPYNNPLIMPLAEFVDAPLVEELLHNGAAIQVTDS